MQAQDVSFCDVVMARKAESESEAVIRLRTELDAEMGKLLEHAKAAGRMRPDFETADVGTLFASIAGAIRASGDGDAWRRQLEFALDGLRA